MRRIHVIILFCLFFGSALSQNKRNIIEKTTFINNDRIGSKILINQIELRPLIHRLFKYAFFPSSTIIKTSTESLIT